MANKPLQPIPPNATQEQLLRALLECFYPSLDGLEWMFREGVSLRDVFGEDGENQLKKYWTNPHE